MSILDKKLFLTELEKRLGDIATVNDVRRIIEQAADVLTGYELTAEAPGGSSESDSLIDLFLSAKSIEGRSEKTIDHYRYVLGRLRDALAQGRADARIARSAEAAGQRNTEPGQVNTTGFSAGNAAGTGRQRNSERLMKRGRKGDGRKQTAMGHYATVPVDCSGL